VKPFMRMTSRPALSVCRILRIYYFIYFF
jgi:hypothetical protein